jgi:chaperone required for assembly of F1-ATPase
MARLDEGEKPRRFYQAAATAPADQGFAVLLDGRAVKTPGGARLILPSEALGGLIASEWEAQGELIETRRMAATRLAFTAIDRTGRARAAVAAEIARYAGSDLLCYLAEQPRSLAEREAQAWGPWLAWAETELGARLTPSFGIAPAVQAPEALRRIETLAAELDDFALTGLAYAAALYGSSVLAFAVARGALDAVEAFELSRLDETFQEERWGIDAEAAARIEILRGQAATLGAWFEALRG